MLISIDPWWKHVSSGTEHLPAPRRMCCPTHRASYLPRVSRSFSTRILQRVWETLGWLPAPSVLSMVTWNDFYSVKNRGNSSQPTVVIYVEMHRIKWKKQQELVVCLVLSHTKCFSGRFAEVDWPTNPSTCPSLLLIWKNELTDLCGSWLYKSNW